MTLEAHYVLDEDSGSTAYDYSGNENHGSHNGGAGPSGTGTVTGPFGNSAYDFDGTDDYIDYGDINSTNGVEQISFSAWIRPASASGTEIGQIIGKADSNSGTDIWQLWYAKDTQTAQVGAYTASGSAFPKASTTISVGEDAHICGTYNSGTIKVYVNGVLENTDSSLSGALRSSSAIVASGARGSGFDQFYEGSISDIRVYTRTISPQEVQALYQAGVQSEVTFEQ